MSEQLKPELENEQTTGSEHAHEQVPEPTKSPLQRALERLIKESEKATSDEKAHATALWESLATVWNAKTKKAA